MSSFWQIFFFTVFNVMSGILCCNEDRFPCNMTDFVVENFIFNGSKPAFNLTIIPDKIKWITPATRWISIEAKFSKDTNMTHDWENGGWWWFASDTEKGMFEGKVCNIGNITIGINSYSGFTLPSIESLKINDVKVCDNGIIENLWEDCIDWDDYETTTLSPIKLENDEDVGCGRRLNGHEEYILGGSQTKVGDYPWHISLYRTQTPSSPLKYTCGGTLITLSRVLTGLLQSIKVMNEIRFW